MLIPVNKTSRWKCNIDFGFALTLFGYEVAISFDLSEWHLSYEHIKGAAYQACIGPFYFDIMDATKYTDPVDPLISQLQDRVFESEKEAAKYYTALKEEKEAHEQDQVRLAGCGVAALGYGENLEPTAYGYSASYQDVYTLWQKYKQALNEVDRLRNKLEKKGEEHGTGKGVSTRRSGRKSKSSK